MKWFQHQADAHDDEIIRELLHKFGTDGIAVWWTTAELVAKVLKVTVDPKFPQGFRVSAKLEADPRVFADALAHKVPIDRYASILKHCARRKRFYFKETKDFWIINWPKLVDFKDNATRDLISSAVKSLASDLQAIGGGGSTAPIGIGTEDSSSKGGAGGTEEAGEAANMAVWFKRIIPAWQTMCSAPGERSKRDHIRDWIRQGVSRRAIEEAPMLPQYQKMDFYKIGEELKRGVNGHGNGHGGGRQVNAGAKEVLRTFALKPGELESATEKRIADRERGEQPK